MRDPLSQDASSDWSRRVEFDNSIRRGTRWVIVAQIASQFISLGVLAALYRLVMPDQFGLLGMVVPLLLLGKIFASFGLNVATVQKRQLTEGQLSTVFWVSLLVSTLVAGAVAASGPLVAWVYQVPQLAQLVAALAGTLVLAAAGAQHRALLERKLRIGRLAGARVIAQATGGLAAVVAAFAQWGVWALVVQQYVELAVLGALVWWLESWRPRRWSQCRAAGDLLRFGGYYSLSSLMFYVAQNMDKILIAWLLAGSREGQTALGLYSQAFNLMMKPVYLVTSPITGVMLPALSRLAHQKHELEQLAARFYRMVAIFLFPCGVGLTVVAVDVMLVLGGESWRPAGYLLMVLAPTVLVQGLLNISGSLFAATGNARALFFGSLATAIVMSGAVLVGASLGGYWAPAPEGPTLGIACCYCAATVLILPLPYLAFCFRVAEVSPRSILAPLTRCAISAILMGVLVWAARYCTTRLGLTGLPQLLLVVSSGVVAYGLLARREIRWFLGQTRELRGGAS